MRIRYFILIFLAISIITELRGQDLKLTPIPDSIRENADAVIRLYEQEIDVRSESSLKMQVHTVMTVMNRSGESKARLMLPYDNFKSPSAINIKIYDFLGKRIKSVKDKDIQDYSSYDGFSLYTDNRIKYYKPVLNSFPYTVEI